jgi:hypothetical protein
MIAIGSGPRVNDGQADMAELGLANCFRRTGLTARDLSSGAQGRMPQRKRRTSTVRRGCGRPPGAKNYFTREVKEPIINAANRSDEDGRGTRGFEGYMFKLSIEEPKTFGMVIRAGMPTEVSVEHKDIEFKSVKDVRAGLARVGLRLEDFMAPPQHGKSWAATDFVAWVAGKNPNTKTQTGIQLSGSARVPAEFPIFGE